MLHISVTSLEDFMTCRRLYYWKRIKKYDRAQFSVPFLVGRVVHQGMNYLFEKKPDALDLTKKFFKQEKKVVQNTFTLTEKQAHTLNEQEFVTIGMLAAYKRKYGAMLKDAKLIASEVEGALQFGDNVTFVIKMDNLLRIRQKKVLHELKTSKYITPEYVKMIQTARQTAVYYHAYNMIFEESPIDEIMYDVIRKPSIKQKKGESYPAFQQRLIEWYDRPDDMACFHVERFKQPLITQDAIFNTIQKVSEEMLRSKDKEDYYECHTSCASYYGDVCPYYELCHEGGETKENMVLYQIRKPYHVNKENVLTKG